ncbi:NADP-dependent oxidoreductase domain-containing protein [Parachaetomium inaequale]|uniref:NADP-dependent oxidoreductase domain-containing protein n=1 Tax=Parachaetomium inaequale TaxID=2588326 RepID=A0AAN6PGR4_9PEZI|nr:NADP-dependent oxidoreductase domain-containing protein [Parachaetomium inaequale]
MATPGPTATAEMPPMMYGTAWKKERTADLVYEAIKAGFRGIDTAAMKKHYDEASTGEGIRRAISEGICSRRDLFIQTKFTPLDDTSSYSLTDSIPAQIHSSLATSLTNLSTPDHDPPYLDALIMHSPFPSLPQTLEAWTALQSYLPTSPLPAHAGKILRLGISNVTLPVLRALSSMEDPVTIVQNRLRAAERHWDAHVRAWCASTRPQVTYQGFWTLTGNGEVWQRAGFVRDVARGAGVSLAAAWYALLMHAGVVVLNGTGDRGHMREDLEVLGRVGAWRATREGEEGWGRCWGEFVGLVGVGGVGGELGEGGA